MLECLKITEVNQRYDLFGPAELAEEFFSSVPKEFTHESGVLSVDESEGLLVFRFDADSEYALHIGLDSMTDDFGAVKELLGAGFSGKAIPGGLMLLRTGCLMGKRGALSATSIAVRRSNELPRLEEEFRNRED